MNTPAWNARPGPEVTTLPAEPGQIRTGANGIQWMYQPGRGWQPVIHAQPEAGHNGPEPEAG